MSTNESTPINLLVEKLDRRCQSMETGNLVVTTHAKVGRLHLFYGRLLYVTGDFHRVRRWQRALHQYSPDWEPETQGFSFEPEKPWEYQLLYQGVGHDQLTLTQAKVIIRQVTLEVVFSLARYADLSYDWEPYDEVKSELSLGLALSFREIEPVLTKVVKMEEQWQAAGLRNLSPVLAPVLKKQINVPALAPLVKYLNGKYTFWDIGERTGKSFTIIARALVPLLKKGIVQLRQLPDFPSPVTTPPASEPTSTADATPAASSTSALIACIDDSAVVVQTLRKILEPAGYKVLGIQDPIKGLAQLAEEKPDLIFLDLMMPNANGYTVCQFLRNAPLFQKTPVIILSSRDNVLDRSRAKLVGASDFLTKPPDPQDTLAVIQKYLAIGKKEVG